MFDGEDVDVGIVEEIEEGGDHRSGAVSPPSRKAGQSPDESG